MDPAVYPSVSGGLLFGTLETLTAPNPAVGADFSIPLAQGYWWRILSGTFIFTTSAVVASRFVAINLNDGNNNIFDTRLSSAHAAGLAVTYSPFRLGQFQFSANALTANLPLPDLWMPPGSLIKTSTLAIDVGDQFSAIAFYCEKVSIKNMLDHYREWAHEPNESAALSPATFG